MEKMWLRLPPLLFIQKQIISHPSCNSLPTKGAFLSLGTFLQGLDPICNVPCAPLSSHLFVTHAELHPPSPSTASSNELGWQAGGGRATVGRR